MVMSIRLFFISDYSLFQAGIEFFGTSTSLVPYTVVPLDTRDCEGGHKKSGKNVYSQSFSTIA